MRAKHGIASSVLTSLEWLVNLSYNLYMISFLQNYPEVTQFSTSQKIVHNRWNIINGTNTPSPLPFSPCSSFCHCNAIYYKDSPVMAG